MKSRQDLIKELSNVQNTYNRLAMEIGGLYARYKLDNNESLLNIINTKVEVFQKVELEMKRIENDLSTS